MTVIGPCPECEGKGYKQGPQGHIKCPKCHGRGHLEAGPDGSEVQPGAEKSLKERP